MRCWGAGTSGKLGQGDTTNRGDGPGEMGDALSAVDLGSAPTPGAMTVTVTADRGSYAPGDTAHLQIEVTNTGPVVLHNVTITTGTVFGGALDCQDLGPVDLPVGAVHHAACDYLVQESDLEWGATYWYVEVRADEADTVVEPAGVTVAQRPTGASGTVSESGSGGPVAGAWVAVLRTSDYSVAAGAVTDATGNYQVQVPAGSYFVFGIDPTGGHAAGFFGAPTTVTVVDHQMVDADPQMAPTRGSVAGTITEAGSGTPIPQGWVIGINATTGATQRGAVANGAGQYNIGGLRVGSYRPVFVDPTGAHGSRYFPDSVDFLGATSLAVTAGGSAAADVALPAQSTTPGAATLSGTVREAGTNAALGGVFVVALRASDFRNAGGAVTNASGQYSLNVAAGDYKLAFVDSTGLHNMEWHDNQPNTGLATATSVTAPAVTGAALDANTGTLAGVVTDASGGPMGGAWILAIGPSGVAGGAITDEDGGYTIAGLAPGVYRAAIIDPVGGRTVEYFENSPDFAGATPLTVTAAHTTTADAALTRPGTQPPVFAGAWGNPGHGHFHNPGPVAVDPTSGEVYVNDGHDRIQKFSANGAFVTQWGRHGHGHGHFNRLGHLAVDGAGNVYATDGDNRIQKFTPTGTFLTQWGTTGTGNGQLNGIAGIAADSADNVYVADPGNYRVQKFSPTGTYLTQWGGYGFGDGQFDQIRSITIDPSDRIYVLDRGHDTGYPRFQKFSSTGAVLPFNSNPTLDPFAIAAYDGGIYATYTSENFYARWEDDGNGVWVYFDSGLVEPGAVAGGPSGLYIQDSGNNRIWHDGGTLGGLPDGDGELWFPHGVAVNGSTGDVYVADTANNRVQRFGATGAYLGEWATPSPGVVAVDPTSGNVYVPAGDEIRKYSPTGTLLTQWGATGSANGQFQGVGAIAVDSSGGVYVADTGNDRVQRFSAAGVYLAQWGTTGDGNGQFHSPSAIAVDPTSGAVYVGDSGRVQKFTATGTYDTQWAAAGSVGGITVDPTSDNVYVSDAGVPNTTTSGSTIQAFSPTGTLLTQWGTLGDANSQFRHPTGVAVGPNGNIYVVDTGNDRIQRFTPP